MSDDGVSDDAGTKTEVLTQNSRYGYTIDSDGDVIVTTTQEILDGFGPNLLHLGDIQRPSQPIDALAVLFDLEGFTDFTRQVDPQLTVPTFLSDFLHWLFEDIKKELISEGNELFAELPFFSKFMGDGVLMLWRIDLDKIIAANQQMTAASVQNTIQRFIVNTVVSLSIVTQHYDKFLKVIQTQHVDPPPRLRCGIARGTVIPIGNGADFVGPCINIAARLQKFNGSTFSFSARGINMEYDGKDTQYTELFVKKRASIRGIGDRELVYVKKSEFEKLPEEMKNKLVDP